MIIIIIIMITIIMMMMIMMILIKVYIIMNSKHFLYLISTSPSILNSQEIGIPPEVGPQNQIAQLIYNQDLF